MKIAARQSIPANGQLSIEQLRTARAQAAVLVEMHGERYLPAFELFDNALLEAERRETTLDRVRLAARDAQQMSNKSVTPQRRKAS